MEYKDGKDKFPIITIDKPNVYDEWIKRYEESANELAESYDVETFTKENIVDAFMMGASMAHKLLANQYGNDIESLKTMIEVRKFIENHLENSK